MYALLFFCLVAPCIVGDEEMNYYLPDNLNYLPTDIAAPDYNTPHLLSASSNNTALSITAYLLSEKFGDDVKTLVKSVEFQWLSGIMLTQLGLDLEGHVIFLLFLMNKNEPAILEAVEKWLSQPGKAPRDLFVAIAITFGANKLIQKLDEVKAIDGGKEALDRLHGSVAFMKLETDLANLISNK